MISARIPRFTRVLGKSQGYMGLAVRDEVRKCSVSGPVPCMTTAWQPTPKELETLNLGGSVYVTIQGTGHPPIMVEVGEAPDEE